MEYSRFRFRDSGSDRSAALTTDPNRIRRASSLRSSFPLSKNTLRVPSEPRRVMRLGRDFVGSTVTSDPTETMSKGIELAEGIESTSPPKAPGIGAAKPPGRLSSFASDGDRFLSRSSRFRCKPRASCTICSFTARHPLDGSDATDPLNSFTASSNPSRYFLAKDFTWGVTNPAPERASRTRRSSSATAGRITSSIGSEDSAMEAIREVTSPWRS